MRQILNLFKDTALGWSRNEAAMHAAAIAYYTIFSLAPLLILSVSIASRMFDRTYVEGKVVSGIEQQFGDAAATVAQEIVRNSARIVEGRIATSLGILLLLYGASVVFLQLQASLNAMWEIERRSESMRQDLVAMLKSRLASAAFVLLIGYLLLVAIFLNTLWAAVPHEYLDQVMVYVERVVPFARLWASPIMFMVVFAVIFKALPQAKIRWRDILPGAALTALLFWLGNYFIGLYVTRSMWSSLYGAAGTVIVFLLWVYYSAWIFLFGAKFTQIYAEEVGTPIRPYPYMISQKRDLIDSAKLPAEPGALQTQDA